MFTKEQTKELSEFLKINFNFPERLDTYTFNCIFNEDNTSYIDYDSETKIYSFHLAYNEVVFQFELKVLSKKNIYEAMKEYNNKMYFKAMRDAKLRSNIYKQLEKLI